MKSAFSPELGRYGIAARNYESGEFISEENFFAIGPKQNIPVVCLGCYKPLTFAGNDRCLKCKWPLCSNCAESPHHAPECEVFVTGKVTFQEVENIEIECIQLDCIMPLRVLLEKEKHPERWDREVEPMEYHDEARRGFQEIWNADLINIARYLRGPCKLSRFSEELIMRVVGILQVNAFEAKTPQGHPIRCLFPQTAILAHNCVPNTIRTIYPSEDYRIKLRTLVAVKKDEQLFVSYTFTLDGTAERQQHLKNGKYFTCRCERCCDPTELGSYFSSLICEDCDSGYISTINPLDNSSDWKCNKCECVIPSSKINAILDPIQDEVAVVEAMPYSDMRLQQTERLHRKYHHILHPLHFIQTNLRQSLTHMYGRVKGYELVTLPDSVLEYKIDLCRLVLKVLDIFEPGLSRSRATALYELYGPLALIAHKLYLCKMIDATIYRSRLGEAISVLQEAVTILENEDSLLPEGVLAVVGKKALEQLREAMSAIDGN